MYFLATDHMTFSLAFVRKRRLLFGSANLSLASSSEGYVFFRETSLCFLERDITRVACSFALETVSIL